METNDRPPLPTRPRNAADQLAHAFQNLLTEYVNLSTRVVEYVESDKVREELVKHTQSVHHEALTFLHEMNYSNGSNRVTYFHPDVVNIQGAVKNS